MSRYDAAYVPRSAMTIFAHPDDAEFGVAGTLARWASQGCTVTMVLCTSGNVGTQDTGLSPAALAETREREQLKAAQAIGAEEVVFLRHDDCQLQPTLELRRDLVRAIRLHRPEVVLCNDPSGWFFGSGYVNHPDHRAAGAAALEAVFPCAEMPLLWPETGPAHKVSAVYIAWTEPRDVWIDIGDALPAKLAALQAHESQLGDWDPTEMITDWARSDAKAARKAWKKAQQKSKRGGKKSEKKKRAKRKRKNRTTDTAPGYTESYRVMVLQHEDLPPES